MTESLSPPARAVSPTIHHSPTSETPPRRTSTSPKPIAREPRTQPHQTRERIPSYAQNRVSAYSQRTSRSRPQSNIYLPLSSSSLSLSIAQQAAPAFVRDFAYPTYHPMHYGPPPANESLSGTTTPGSDWASGRRASDSAEAINGGGVGSFARGAWTAGPWGGDGAIYGEPSGEDIEALPSTSFAGGSADTGDAAAAPTSRGYGKNRHRKSKSYASVSDFERGRRRESGGYHGSGGGGVGGVGSDRGRDADMFYFSGGSHSQYSDPAGRESLRLSRGNFGATAASAATAGENNGVSRRDSRYNDTTLPSRRFHASSASSSSSTSQMVDTDSDLPLDAEYSAHSPQRESLGPEDEELFAGPSLALYNFEPENPNELRLVEGQTILVSYRHGQGWLVAEDPSSGEQGLVPEEYVRLLRDIEGWDAEKGRFIEDEDEDEEQDEEDSLVVDATQQMEDGDPIRGLAQSTDSLRVKDDRAPSGVDSPVQTAVDR